MKKEKKKGLKIIEAFFPSSKLLWDFLLQILKLKMYAIYLINVFYLDYKHFESKHFIFLISISAKNTEINTCLFNEWTNERMNA